MSFTVGWKKQEERRLPQTTDEKITALLDYIEKRITDVSKPLPRLKELCEEGVKRCPGTREINSNTLFLWICGRPGYYPGEFAKHRARGDALFVSFQHAYNRSIGKVKDDEALSGKERERKERFEKLRKQYGLD